MAAKRSSASPKVEVGANVLEAEQVILTFGGELISEEPTAFNDNGGCTGTSVAWTPFSSLQERLHFPDKGTARINSASIL